MNAQEKWKQAYRRYRLARHKFSSFYETDELGETMFRYRREAALERIIARQARTIAALAARIAELEDEVWEAQEQIERPEMP